jgi:hypothetical protein
MSRTVIIPTHSQPRPAIDIGLHAHHDNSSGGKIRAKDILGLDDFLSTSTTVDHGLLTGLADDDHAQYLLLAGRSTGQTAYGATSNAGSLTLSSTAHATKGKIYLGSALASAYDEANDRLGINKAAPDVKLHVVGNPQPGTITVAGDSQVADSGIVGTITGVTLNGTTTVTKSGSGFNRTPATGSWGDNSPSGRCLVTGTGVPANTYVAGFVSSTNLTLSAACTAGTVDLTFYEIDRGLDHYPAHNVFGTPGSAWQYVATSDGATSFAGRDCGTGTSGYRRYTPSSSFGSSSTSWTVTFSARYEGVLDGGTAARASSIVFTINRADGNYYTGTATLTSLTSSFADYTCTVSSFVGASSLFDELKMQIAPGSAFTGYIEVSYVAISATGAGVGDAAITHVHRSASTSLPYSIWSNESSVTVASIESGGAGRFRNLELMDATGADADTIIHAAPTSITQHTLTWPGATATGILKNTTSGTIGTLSWVDPETIVDVARTWTTLQKFPDDKFRIVGSSTATKLLAFEVDGLSVGTHTLTPQDADYIIAGTNIQNSFSVRQTFANATLGNEAVQITPPVDTVALMLQNLSGASPTSNLLTLKTNTGGNLGGISGSGVLSVVDNSGSNNPLVLWNGLGGATGAVTVSVNSVASSVTWNFPNSSGTTFVGTTASQTLTNKILETSCVWSAPSAATKTAGWSLAGASSGFKLTLASSHTANRTATFQDATGTLAYTSDIPTIDAIRTWSTLQTFKDTTFKLIDATTATNTLVFDLPTAGTGIDVTLSVPATADRTITLPDATTTLAGLAVAQTFTKAQTITPDSNATALTITGTNLTSANVINVTDYNGVASFRMKFNGPIYLCDSDGSSANEVVRFYKGSIDDAGSFYGSFTTGSLTANRSISFPDISGQMVLAAGAQTIQGKTFSSATANYINVSAMRFRKDTSSTTDYFVFGSAGATGARTLTLPDTTGNVSISGNTTVAGAGTAAAGAMGKLDVTAQAASIGTTTLVTGNAGSVGMFRVSVATTCSTAGADKDTIKHTIGWTTAGVARTQVSATIDLDNTANQQNVVYTLYADASTNITLTTTYTQVGGAADGKYDLHSRVTFLG